MNMLKKILVVVLVVLTPGTMLLSQVEKGDKELSVAASFTHITIKEGGYSDSVSTFRLAGRLGFFVSKKFEIEPEICLGKMGEDLFDDGDMKMAYILSLNLAYHFKPDSKTVPFVLAGFGISNTIPYFHNVVIWGIEDETFKVFNAGAGFKFFLSKSAAIRLEYRFQYYFDGENGFGLDLYYHYGLVGISIFL